MCVCLNEDIQRRHIVHNWRAGGSIDDSKYIERYWQAINRLYLSRCKQIAEMAKMSKVYRHEEWFWF